MKTDIIRINAATALLYGITFFIQQKLGYSLPVNIIGIGYLLFVTPLTIIHLFPFSKQLTTIEKLLALIVSFFCLYVPLYYFLNRSAGFEISVSHALIINAAILVIAFIIRISRHDENEMRIPSLQENIQTFKKERLFIGFILLYFAIHIANYSLYGFIPEWDSYSDLIKIQRGLQDGFVQQSYRGFFDTSAQVLSNFSFIDPYYIFSVIFIALQSSLIITLRALIGTYVIKGWAIPSLVYTAALSIPVINMEIDMVRPQNIFILLFPIFLYFTSRFFSEKRAHYAVIASIIPMAGMNYHEFFIFPLFILITYAWFILFKTAYRSNDRRDRTIFILATLSAALIGILLAQKIGFIGYAVNTVQNITIHILDFHAWRPWFLGSYASDGETLQMGWPGMDGAFKYYAYYLSPALLVTLLFLAYSLVKRSPLFKDAIIRATFPLIGIFFLFSEILPRMNYLYLPERLWLPTDIALIFSLIPVLLYISEKQNFRKVATGTLILLIIGLAGSFYVAINKKSLTSEDEYRAALWIRNNTPKKSLFITQSANGPMVSFFADRATLPVSPEYFLSGRIIEQDPEKEVKRLKNSLDEDLEAVAKLTDMFTSNELRFFDFADAIQEKKLSIKTKSKQLEQWRESVDQPKYVLYSFDKFNTLYQERTWWRRENFYGADIEKFNDTYPLVYHDGGVYIWKVR